MKNKLLYLILALVVSFSFIDSAYAQCIRNDDDYPAYEEPSLQDFDYQVCDAYHYFSLGVGPVIFIPNLGIGYRERHNKWGWDTALSFSTIGYAHELTAHLVGHYYLSPFRQDSTYLGFGIIGSGILVNHHRETAGTLSPDFVFGKEFEKKEGSGKSFLEMHVAMPTLWMGSHFRESTYFPLMYIKYGMAF
jgi:hypothetical protein